MDKPTTTEVTSFTLNGSIAQVEPLPGERLSYALRERLDRKDVKIGCNAGDCGACTVLVDGAPVCACLMPVAQAEGRDVVTVEGLAQNGQVADLQAAFQRHGAAQCGICSPGMLMAAQALLAAKAGATFVSPFVGRHDDNGFDGMALIRDIRLIYDNYPNFSTEILVASIRNPVHVLESARIGADVATMPAAVIKGLFKHVLTEKGIEGFLKDWDKTGQSIPTA